MHPSKQLCYLVAPGRQTKGLDVGQKNNRSFKISFSSPHLVHVGHKSLILVCITCAVGSALCISIQTEVLIRGVGCAKKVIGDERYQRGASAAQGVDEESKETGSHSLHWSLIRYCLMLLHDHDQYGAFLLFLLFCVSIRVRLCF